MNKALKVGLISGVAVGALWLGSKVMDGLKLAQNISFKLSDFGIPKISGNVLSIPVKILITNPTDAQITVNSVAVAVYLLKVSEFVRIGQANLDNVPTSPGTNEKTFTAQFDIKGLTSNLFDTLAQILSSRSITVKADVQVVAQGVGLPVQTITKTISLV